MRIIGGSRHGEDAEVDPQWGPHVRLHDPFTVSVIWDARPMDELDPPIMAVSDYDVMVFSYCFGTVDPPRPYETSPIKALVHSTLSPSSMTPWRNFLAGEVLFREVPDDTARAMIDVLILAAMEQGRNEAVAWARFTAMQAEEGELAGKVREIIGMMLDPGGDDPKPVDLSGVWTDAPGLMGDTVEIGGREYLWRDSYPPDVSVF